MFAQEGEIEKTKYLCTKKNQLKILIQIFKNLNSDLILQRMLSVYKKKQQRMCVSLYTAG